MSTVSTHPHPPRGCRFFRKLRFLFFLAFLVGLIAFGAKMCLKDKHHPHHHHHGHHYQQYAQQQQYNHANNQKILELMEEVRQLKINQYQQRTSIESLHRHQVGMVQNQGEMNTLKDSLIQEFMRVEAIVGEVQRANRNLQAQIQAQDQNIKILARNLEMNKGHKGGNPHESKQLMMELEAFRNILQGFETKINSNNNKIAHELREIRNLKTSGSSVSANDIEALQQAQANGQRLLWNEIRNQKSQISQISETQIKQARETKEMNTVLSNLKDYTLQAVDKLARDNISNEKKLSMMERMRASPVNGKASGDMSTLATDLKNFREYTMEALQEIRNQHNKNTKRINHIESKNLDNEAVPISELVSHEVEKFVANLSDGQVINKFLEDNNINMAEVENITKVLKLVAGGDVDGLVKTLNDLSGGKLDNLVNLASWLGYGKTEKAQAESGSGAYRSGKNKKAEKRFKLEDLVDWL